MAQNPDPAVHVVERDSLTWTSAWDALTDRKGICALVDYMLIYAEHTDYSGDRTQRVYFKHGIDRTYTHVDV